MPREVLSNLGLPFTQLVLDTYAYERLSLMMPRAFLACGRVRYQQSALLWKADAWRDRQEIAIA